MKSVVALCVLAALCVFQASADPMDGVKKEIEKFNSDLEATLVELRRSRNSVEHSTKKRLGNLKIQYMTDINGVINEAVPKLRVKVDAAKKEGKNAEPCYEGATTSLVDVIKSRFHNLETCEFSASQGFQSQLRAYNELEQDAKEIQRSLEAILLDCWYADHQKMESCAKAKLVTINSSVRKFQENVSLVVHDVDLASDDAIMKGNSCYMSTINMTRDDTNAVMSTAEECLNNA